MNTPRVFLRIGLITVAFILMISGASAWTIQNWAGPADGAALSPGTVVNAPFEINFNLWSDNKFDSAHSITLYSDLADAQWTATKTVMVNDETPVTTQLVSRKAIQVKLSGWDLSDSQSSYKVTVRLTGTVPEVPTTQGITVLRIQEVDSDASLISGSVVKKTVTVEVPTPEPTLAPTPEETMLVLTPEQTSAAPTATAISPTKKQTYSPGPDPLVICGVLACFLIGLGMARRRN